MSNRAPRLPLPTASVWWIVGGLILSAACAQGSVSDTEAAGTSNGSAGAGSGGDGGSSSGGAAGQGGAGGEGAGGTLMSQSCTDEEFAIGIDPSGVLQCAPIEPAVRSAVNDHCKLYWGWRDSCNGCTSDPAKWGEISGSDCKNGLGADNTCIDANLGANSVGLFGLNTDGDVDGDDKFYLGMHCSDVAPTPTPGPCDANAFAVGSEAGQLNCIPAAAVVLDYVRDHCSVYFGWRDGCNGCTSNPAKWGSANQTACINGSGSDNTCTLADLGGPIVQLFGLNTDGSVGGDDKFFFGMHCGDAAGGSDSAVSECPNGQLVVGVNADGTVDCSSPQLLAQDVVREDCRIHAGWRDSCGACTTPPSKWGSVNHSSCSNGAGADNTCTVAALGGETVRLFGLNPDGDMDGNDKMSLGFGCY